MSNKNTSIDNTDNTTNNTNNEEFDFFDDELFQTDEDENDFYITDTTENTKTGKKVYHIKIHQRVAFNDRSSTLLEEFAMGLGKRSFWVNVKKFNVVMNNSTKKQKYETEDKYLPNSLIKIYGLNNTKLSFVKAAEILRTKVDEHFDNIENEIELEDDLLAFENIHQDLYIMYDSVEFVNVKTYHIKIRKNVTIGTRKSILLAEVVMGYKKIDKKHFRYWVLYKTFKIVRNKYVAGEPKYFSKKALNGMGITTSSIFDDVCDAVYEKADIIFQKNYANRTE